MWANESLNDGIKYSKENKFHEAICKTQKKLIKLIILIFFF